jgi:hypothetical protein
MDPKKLTDQLAEADQDVAAGQQLAERQVALIEQLAREGRETVLATELLTQLQAALASHTQERDRLRKLLSDLEQLRVIKKNP